eukprot:Blabericola_migrator_1__13070@NODE_883_length_6173_cov_565_747625_g623_i0_p3_GENE_NODE_883_length_6173_cov_565_747625_g623_i0NODE_883_length_6173_cov_565_747625_g623_i0_p3_ORF_typecomplete_len271_score34_85APH/PF01636_23/0_0018APH/PF01636_23/1_5e03WaaY/PF06176_11/7_7e03WaaY/PF06176_11/0_0061Kdo/PF06293_14/0_025Pkinase/PF00069_25/0_0098RIO1/PF01163_22/7_4e03RIO1/PF01163_22/0_018Haspin_kinase/PF12330_8/0_0098TSP_1/PF00090_19/0_024TSP_1/PF00090_19/6_6e03Pox_serthr_kin/PF05445_11/0_038DUF1679/PF0791
MPQTNLQQEALNLIAFGRNFSDPSSVRLLAKTGGRIKFPKVYTTESTQEVLVENMEDGIPFDSWMQLSPCNEDCPPGWMRRFRLLSKRPPIHDFQDCDNERARELGRHVARVGAHMFLQMLIYDNLVHTDLHPGNILIRARRPDELKEEFEAEQRRRELEHPVLRRLRELRSNMRNIGLLRSRKPLVELVILDAGLTSHLGPRDRKNFIDLFRALAFGDGYRAGELLLHRARHHACTDPHGFCEAVAKVVATFVGPQIRLWDLVSDMIAS